MKTQGQALPAGAAVHRDGEDGAITRIDNLLVNTGEVRVGGEAQPGDHPRDRVHGSLRASRGGLAAAWNVHAVSGYENTLKTGRYKACVGHDVTLRWRDPFGLKGMNLATGVLNLTDRGPSVDSADPGAADARLDSARGHTFFLRVGLSW